MAQDKFELGGFVGVYDLDEDTMEIQHPSLTGPIVLDADDASNLEVILKALQLRVDASDSIQADHELEKLESRHDL